MSEINLKIEESRLPENCPSCDPDKNRQKHMIYTVSTKKKILIMCVDCIRTKYPEYHENVMRLRQENAEKILWKRFPGAMIKWDVFLKTIALEQEIRCDCNDWKKHMPEIINAIVMQTKPVHDVNIPDGRIIKIETGMKVFNYCPWCGNKLEKRE